VSKQTNLIELPLYSDLDYRYSISLEGVSWQLRFYWVQRAKSWHIDIRQDNNAPVVLGYALVAQYPILEDFHLETFGLTGRFLLMPVNVAVAQQLEVESGVMPEFFKLFYQYQTKV